MNVPIFQNLNDINLYQEVQNLIELVQEVNSNSNESEPTQLSEQSQFQSTEQNDNSVNSHQTQNINYQFLYNELELQLYSQQNNSSALININTPNIMCNQQEFCNFSAIPEESNMKKGTCDDNQINQSMSQFEKQQHQSAFRQITDNLAKDNKIDVNQQQLYIL